MSASLTDIVRRIYIMKVFVTICFGLSSWNQRPTQLHLKIFIVVLFLLNEKTNKQCLSHLGDKMGFLDVNKTTKRGTRKGYLFFDKSPKGFVRLASFVNIMLHHVQNRKVWLSHGLAADENAHKRRTFLS